MSSNVKQELMSLGGGGIKIWFERHNISEEGLEQFSILMNFKTNFKGQKQRLSSNVKQELMCLGGGEFKIWFERHYISEEGLEQFSIFNEF